MTTLSNDDPTSSSSVHPEENSSVLVGGLPQIKDEDHTTSNNNHSLNNSNNNSNNNSHNHSNNNTNPNTNNSTPTVNNNHSLHTHNIHQQHYQPQPLQQQQSSQQPQVSGQPQYDPHHPSLYHSTSTSQHHQIHDPQLTSHHQQVQQQQQHNIIPQHQLHQQHHLSHNPVAAAAAAAAAAQQQQQQQLQHHLVQYGAPDQQDHINVQLTQQLPSFPTSLTPQHHSHFQQQQQQLQRQLQQQQLQQQLHHQQQQQQQQVQQQQLGHHQISIPAPGQQQQQHLQQQHLQQQHLQQHQHQQVQQQQQHHLDLLAATQSHEHEFGDNITNRKVAPRSTDLFRVGPQFSETRHHQEIYCKGNDVEVNPILEARIDRGFEIGENGNWIGYKRNYFTLVSAFTLENFNFERFMNNKFYTFEKNRNGTTSSNGINTPNTANGNGHHNHHPHLQQHSLNHHLHPSKVEISYFAIRLVAKCSDDDVSISLIQHTAKRDKGPQFPPPIYPAVPGDLPDHETVKASCNKRNGNKIESMNKVFYFDRNEYYHHINLNSMKDDSILKNYPSDSIAKIARFERIQFTSSIRIKSASANSRYFTLHVELLGIIEDEDMQIQPILLSSIETPPLIIRGRSPSNYHKDRTSGYRGQND
ncbi:hypothetical protein DFJ63DRAFT_335966 [Scheffersomyces coipomensis]|uniref:uncharacterized protein n=1 Tax=Scheffersomyces coipomensis TaxID=1788519 RepID=UPI00315CEFC9